MSLRVLLQTATSIAKRNLGKSPADIAEGDLELLVDTVNSVTKEMLGVDQILKMLPTCDPCPITFVDVDANQHLYCGVIILPQGTRIPLHDHPNMYGIIKPLEGEIRLKSFSLLESETEGPVKAIEAPELLLNNLSKAQLLTPSQRNVHGIEYVNGEKGGRFAAFLDLLFPPYNEHLARPCHYFKKLHSTTTKGNEATLVEIDAPDYYITRNIRLKSFQRFS